MIQSLVAELHSNVEVKEWQNKSCESFLFKIYGNASKFELKLNKQMQDLWTNRDIGKISWF